MRKVYRRQGDLIFDYDRDTELQSTGCRNWRWSYFKTGYPQVKYEGKTWKVGRLVWHLYRNSIPKGLFILHNCFNSKCVNIEHLRLGSNQENSQDFDRAKLNREQIIEINKLLEEGKLNQRQISEIYDVDASRISNINTKIAWNNIRGM